MSHQQIFFDESQYITDEMLEQIDLALPPESRPQMLVLHARRTSHFKTWFKANELEILLFILLLTLLGLYLILPYIPTILWDITTPLTHLLGGQ